MVDVCQQCGNEYERIGSHWSKSKSCKYPELTQVQYETVVGILMGDGTINRGGKNPYLQIEMISPNYLEYVANKFEIFGGEVRMKHTAEEKAELVRESGFNTNAESKNYSNIYVWSSMAHPDLHEFSEWYSSGKKVWPKDIELTPTVLKHWYCGDGTWKNDSSSNYIKIAMSNEVENVEKVDGLFKSSNLPSPYKYDIHRRKGGGKRCSAMFTVEQSKELWEYMGGPLPDFEYKWPKQYRNL